MDLGHDLGLSALGQGNATVLSLEAAPLRPAPVLLFFLSAFCWCSFAGTLTSRAFARALEYRAVSALAPRNGVGEPACSGMSDEEVEAFVDTSHVDHTLREKESFICMRTRNSIYD